MQPFPAFLKKLPKAALRRIGNTIDLIDYAIKIRLYKKLLGDRQESERQSLLIISGNGMNVVWAQIWALLSLPVRMQGYTGYVLTNRRQRTLNGYFRLMGLRLIHLDDYPLSADIPPAIREATASATDIESFRTIHYQSAPVGQIALSTYSRNFGTGLIDFSDPKVTTYIRQWIGRVCHCMDLAQRIFAERRVDMLFVTEVFMEEYGAFYYAALNAKLNIVRFAGTVRDDAFIMQHLSKENDRIHHSSLDKTTWEKIQRRSDDAAMEAELAANFMDRYGDKWHRSKRGHPNTQMPGVEQAKAQLGITPGRKVAVIYSHILYDTLFFFGTDLFKDYSEWLVETARAAIANPHIDWLIKVHPSNLWRGEMDTLLKGRFEEERLLQNALGALPPHVRIVGADTKINPYTWFQLADYGITVRGTSGLEMAAFGKTVITAGTGRYEGNGFTVDPANASEYLNILRRLHELAPPSREQTRLAKRYAHAIFVLKPYTLSSLTPRRRFGCKTVYLSDDLIYIPTGLRGNSLPKDLEKFGQWAINPADRDLLADI
jgi:hypothetical protein